MRKIITIALASLSVFLLPAASLANPLDAVGSRAEGIETKRFSKKIWSQPEGSALQNKRFPIQEWDKHFSAVGSQRAPIALKEARGKKSFKTKVLDQKKVPMDLSRWSQSMADLHSRAGIQVDDRSRLSGDHRLYRAMMDDARFYRDMGEVLSLRDINRYQFRHNRPDGKIPSAAAGAQQ